MKKIMAAGSAAMQKRRDWLSRKFPLMQPNERGIRLFRMMIPLFMEKYSNDEETMLRWETFVCQEFNIAEKGRNDA